MSKAAFLPFRHELLLDWFAGGGGASTGIEAAFGRPVDVAVNHDANGFPRGYVIDPLFRGKPLNKTQQVRLVGNSVCPGLAEAIIRANFAHEQQYEAVGA